MTRPGGLGRGLGALIPASGPGATAFMQLDLRLIVPNPRQPRGDFDEQELEELAHSLREVGLLQPVVVRPLAEGRYELIAGERRVRAARLAGFEELPAVVRETEEGERLTEALVENLHRSDLNPLEEAAAYQQLLEDFGMTHEALAEKLGKSRSAISNGLRLLSLPVSLQQHLISGDLTAGHARALLALPDHDAQERAGARILKEGLTVRQAEELVRTALAPPDGDASPRRSRQSRPSPYEGLQRRLADVLATRVQIAGTPKRGKIVIDYAGEEDLERLLAVLGRGAGEDLLSEPS
jgi:ParB family transcriptional regulator, chromosome partitioning protein